MKTSIRSVFAVLASFSLVCAPSARAELAIATSSLPDAQEEKPYTESLTAEGGTEPYAWSVVPAGYVETTGASTFAEIGMAQGWHGDDDCWTLELPFAFPFFGNDYTSAKVNSNGTISFGESFFNDWSYTEEAFLDQPMIAVLWQDLTTDAGGDIYVASDANAVTIFWRCDSLSGGAVNASATLCSDGRIVLSYGDGNEYGGFIGVSKGDGETQVVSDWSESGSMDRASDIVFVPATLPGGVSLAADGTISGTPFEPGEYPFLAVVTDNEGNTASKTLTLSVAENPALRPAVVSANPDPGYVNIAGDTPVAFTVSATHPGGGTVSYAWSMDGNEVETGATFAGIPNPTYDELHAIRCVVSGSDLPKTRTIEWQAGVLAISDPESATVSYGQRATLSVSVESPLAATVTWFDADTNDEVGTGETLTIQDATQTFSYYAVAENALGSVKSAAATVTVDPAPAIGRIYRMTGPSFVGNRLVLRAKPYGDLSNATYAWKRDGVTVATKERLDIASLTATDFGSYTLTVTTDYGTATSETYVLEPAPAGVPVGWGASGHGRTTPPEGESGFVQIASGMNFNLGLKTDGTVVAWGYNGHGGCDVPDGLSDVSSVAAGGYESQGAGFAVKTDGSVVAWGQPMETHTYWDDWAHYDNDSDTYTGDWYTYTNGWDTVGTIPDDLDDVVQVAVGGEFALALKADGTVVSWGAEGGWLEWDENLGENVWVPERYYAVPLKVRDVVAIAAGHEHAVAILADGSVLAWGREQNNSGQYDVPPGLPPIAAVSATKAQWSAASLALDEAGVVHKWGDPYNYTGYETGTLSDIVALDGGQEHFITLGSDGSVQVWCGWNSYGMLDLPDELDGGAFGVAAGGYHCTALLPDADGDTISDAEEILLGRDPNTWEDWHRASLSGTVTVGGGDSAAGALVSVYDASGRLAGRTRADDGGFYAIDGLVPAGYFVSVEAAGAEDAWADNALPPDNGIEDTLAPGVPWASGAAAPVMVGEGAPACDFDLAPGELAAWARVTADKWTIESDEDDREEVALPDGTKVYLDMWPVETDDDLAFDLGEVAASHSALDGLALLPHMVTVRRPEADAQVPSPDRWVPGEEGRIVAAKPSFSGETGAVTIVTDPAGAEVWIDYADESLGVTPLTVDRLAAGASHCHVLLLRKEGYLRPRPIEFELSIGGENRINVPLAADSEPAMAVAVASGIPGMPIYLDYLPTEQVTPAMVGGMDPASHAGDLWHSASHSILLRDERLRPFAPRAVPEPEVDLETGEPIPSEPIELFVVAPNSYDDSDGDGIPNVVEATGGTDPFGTEPDAYTGMTPVPVPHRWLDGYPALLSGSGIDYEAAALADSDVDGSENWREFVAGTDPTDPDDVFRATITFENGVPKILGDPYLPGTREYILEASDSLDGEFRRTDNPDNGSDIRFYRVKVRLR